MSNRFPICGSLADDSATAVDDEIEHLGAFGFYRGAESGPRCSNCETHGQHPCDCVLLDRKKWISTQSLGLTIHVR